MARQMAEYRNGICIKSGWRERNLVRKPEGTQSWCDSCINHFNDKCNYDANDGYRRLHCIGRSGEMPSGYTCKPEHKNKL